MPGTAPESPSSEEAGVFLLGLPDVHPQAPDRQPRPLRESARVYSFSRMLTDWHLPRAGSRGPWGRGQTQPLPLGALSLGRSRQFRLWQPETAEMGGTLQGHWEGSQL